MSKITPKKRNKKSYGGIIAIAVTIVLVVAVLGGVVLLYVNSNQKLGEALRPKDYDEYVYKYSSEYNLNPNLVFGVIKTESNFNPDAGSNAGALGLMQIMPETFDWLQTYKDGEVTLSTDSLYDPETNIKYGCLFLRFLLDRYAVEETAVAAYNAGFGAVDGWLENSEYSDDGMHLKYIPYPETEAYVEKVEWAKNYYDSDGNNENKSTESYTDESENGK